MLLEWYKSSFLFFKKRGDREFLFFCWRKDATETFFPLESYNFLQLLLWRQSERALTFSRCLPLEAASTVAQPTSRRLTRLEEDAATLLVGVGGSCWCQSRYLEHFLYHYSPLVCFFCNQIQFLPSSQQSVRRPFLLLKFHRELRSRRKQLQLEVLALSSPRS
jgi:hypothetical protein